MTAKADELSDELAIVENEIKSRDYEIGVVIGRNGLILHTVDGQEHSVDIPSSLVKGNVFTHNHPGGICAFSQGDVLRFIADEGYELRVVTRDGRFVSLKEENSLPLGASLAEALYEADFTNQNLYKQADLRAINKYGRGNYSIKQINEETEIIINTWFHNNAMNYGYNFAEGRYDLDSN